MRPSSRKTDDEYAEKIDLPIAEKTDDRNFPVDIFPQNVPVDLNLDVQQFEEKTLERNNEGFLVNFPLLVFKFIEHLNFMFSLMAKIQW